MSQAFIGVVLAGGRSTRMGQDKALLELNGRSLLEHAVQLLRDASASRVLVSGCYAGYDCIEDRVPGLGPVGGIASVASALPATHALFVAVDMTGLDHLLLLQLLAGLQGHRAARFAGQPLPWAVRVDSSFRAATATLMQCNPAGVAMHALHAAVDGIDLPAGDGLARLRNVNTPQDWRNLPR